MWTEHNLIVFHLLVRVPPELQYTAPRGRTLLPGVPHLKAPIQLIGIVRSLTKLVEDLQWGTNWLVGLGVNNAQVCVTGLRGCDGVLEG